MNRIELSTRDNKISLKKQRSAGIIPGVLFGGDTETKSVSLEENILKKFLNTKGTIYKVSNDNRDCFVMFDEVQSDPATSKPLHFSLKVLPKGQESSVDVPISFQGNDQKQGDKGLYVTFLTSVSVNGVPSEIPKEVKVDLSSLELGESFNVDDIKLADNLSIDLPSDTVVAQYQYATAETLELSTEEPAETIVENSEDPIKVD